MLSFVAWLAASRVGRVIGASLLVLSICGLLGLWLLNLGKRREQQRQHIETSIVNTAVLAKRIAVDTELSGLPLAARRERLRLWATRSARQHRPVPDPAAYTTNPGRRRRNEP